jgi:hypothetical protein
VKAIDITLSGGDTWSVYVDSSEVSTKAFLDLQALGFGVSMTMDSEELLTLGLFLAREGKKILDGKKG